MKKNHKETDIPDLFRIKKLKIDEQQIKDSWESIEKKIAKMPKKIDRTH